MKITIRIDRRAEVLEELIDELRSLGETVQGLGVRVIAFEDIEAARDAGKFRDFVDVATLEHEQDEVVEWAAEELIDEFGWLVDVSR